MNQGEVAALAAVRRAQARAPGTVRCDVCGDGSQRRAAPARAPRPPRRDGARGAAPRGRGDRAVVAAVGAHARHGHDRAAGARRRWRSHPVDRPAGPDRQLSRPGQPPRPAVVLPARAVLPAGRCVGVGHGAGQRGGELDGDRRHRGGRGTPRRATGRDRDRRRCAPWPSAATASPCSRTPGTRTSRCSSGCWCSWRPGRWWPATTGPPSWWWPPAPSPPRPTCRTCSTGWRSARWCTA